MNLFSVLLQGAWVTLEVFILTLVFSIPLALVIMFGRMSKNRVARSIVSLYLLVIRGTPLILQLIFVYFAPGYLYRFLQAGLGAAIQSEAFWSVLQFLLSYDRFVAAIIAFVLNYAAYFAEIYRSGIEAIPVGQYEAARSLGLSEQQIFVKVILPQFIKHTLPSLANEVITLVKDTALAQVIGVMELFHYARSASAREFSTAPIFAAGLIYLVMNWLVSILFNKLEKKLAYYSE